MLPGMPEKTQPDVVVATSNLPSGTDYTGETAGRLTRNKWGGVWAIGENCGQERAIYECMTKPPSTLIVWPVTWRARFEARNVTMSAMSEGCCHVPSGTNFLIFSPAHVS
jgi:hypothetical protein